MYCTAEHQSDSRGLDRDRFDIKEGGGGEEELSAAAACTKWPAGPVGPRARRAARRAGGPARDEGAAAG